MEIVNKDELSSGRSPQTGEDSLSSKLSREEITIKEYRDGLARRNGFEDNNEYNRHLNHLRRIKNDSDFKKGIYLTGKDSPSARLSRGEITDKEYRNELSKRRGFNNFKDYMDFNARENGFKDDTDRKRSDGSLPMNENKNCPAYLGIHVAEHKIAKNILTEIFDSVQCMPGNNIGYDFLVDNKIKIEVKASSLQHRGYSFGWRFHIRDNDIADYFLLISFDNRIDLNINYIWIISGEEQFNNRNLWDREDFTIYKNDVSIKRFKKYDVTDKYVK